VLHAAGTGGKGQRKRAVIDVHGRGKAYRRLGRAARRQVDRSGRDRAGGIGRPAAAAERYRAAESADGPERQRISGRVPGGDGLRGRAGGNREVCPCAAETDGLGAARHAVVVIGDGQLTGYGSTRLRREPNADLAA